MARTTTLTRPTRTPVRMVVFDAERPGIVHARLDCPEHLGLIEAVEQLLGDDCADLDSLAEAAGQLGLYVPADLAEHARPCPHCTLVAAPYWRAAA